MSLFSFVKEAGEKLLGLDDNEPEVTEVPEVKPAGANTSAATLHLMLTKHNLAPDDLSIGYADGVVTVQGTAASVEQREKIILAVGNVRGVSQIDDQLSLEGDAPDPVFYTVERGDTLSGIAKTQYGNAMKYMVIFEANRPLLEDPDRIYPGQVLRIPPLDD